MIYIYKHILQAMFKLPVSKDFVFCSLTDSIFSIQLSAYSCFLTSWGQKEYISKHL